MDDNDEPKNIFKFGTITGGKEVEEQEDTKLPPQHDYMVVDLDDNAFEVNGFLIFTTHHLAIMKNDGDGVIPALVLPFERVKAAGLTSVFDTNEDPTLF